MQIAVLSGKGGTGKTTVATNLATIMKYRYVDCDVEEPNGFLFLSPDINQVVEVDIPNPVVDRDLCTTCSKCVNICQFNALAVTKKGILLFEKMCHGCGACIIVCSEDAITEKGRNVGRVEIGENKDTECIRGILNIGEPMSGPVISKVKEYINDSESSIIDCPPGSSCNVVKALDGVDYAIFVSEPTEFGIHDLRIVVELAKKAGIPYGLIINMADSGSTLLQDYCRKESIKLLGTIPYDIKAARLYSKGKLLIEDESFRDIFSRIADSIREELKCS